MTDRQAKTIQWTINLSMDFPSDWDDDMIAAISLVNLKNTMRKMVASVEYVKQKWLRR